MPSKTISHIEDVSAVRYVKRYFELRENGRPFYTGSRFETFAGGGDLVEPNRITPADLLSLSLLEVEVSGSAVLGILGDHASEIETLLGRIPVEAKLEEISEAEFEQLMGDGSPVDTLWELLRQKADPWRFGPTRTSKILARKRPHLVPIYDSVIKGQTTLPHSGPQWPRWFSAFQGEEGQDLSARLRRIRDHAGQPHLSLLRVLDIILWMNGARGETITKTVVDED